LFLVDARVVAFLKSIARVPYRVGAVHLSCTGGSTIGCSPAGCSR